MDEVAAIRHFQEQDEAKALEEWRTMDEPARLVWFAYLKKLRHSPSPAIRRLALYADVGVTHTVLLDEKTPEDR